MSIFHDETAVEPVPGGDQADGTGTFSGLVSERWNIGANPNGGYLVAIALGAIQRLVPTQPDALSITTHFLRPGVPGEVCEVQVELIRAGATISTLRASVIQQGKARLAVLAAMGNLATGKPGEVITVPAPPMPAPDVCPQRSGAEQGIELPLLERMDIRIHPDEAKAGAAGVARISGWIRFCDETPADTRALVTFTDAFPPSVFGSLGVLGWVPTVELTVHVRRRPAPGWIQGQFETQDLGDGRMIESGMLWDSTGALVAQVRQIQLVLARD